MTVYSKIYEKKSRSFGNLQHLRYYEYFWNAL